jgi:hypothetical protein
LGHLSRSIVSLYRRLRRVHGVCVVESDVIEIEIEIVSNRIKSGTRRFRIFLGTRDCTHPMSNRTPLASFTF